MGINGLIPFLSKASEKVHLDELRGKTVAIDAYCWLHKGVYSCANKLAMGEDTDLYIRYCLKYVQLLLSFNIKPILVFDGRHLPAKALTEKRRRESRQSARKRAGELLRLGRVEEAHSQMRRSIDVTHDMALRLIRECRARNVDCIVAPYEADAQMAWFDKMNVAQYIITEDSDLTLFGARKIIFKLDLTGHGLLITADKFHLAMGCSQEKYTFEKFRIMCILSGCDYLDSLPGIGLAKACKFILKTEQNDVSKALRNIPSYLNMKNLEVNEEYIDSFLKAEATFRHMYVYDPINRRMERLHDLQEYNTDDCYCSNAGSTLPPDQALQLSLGNINPFTLERVGNWNPDMHGDAITPLPKNVLRGKHHSIWSGNFKTDSEPIVAGVTKPISFFQIGNIKMDSSQIREVAMAEEKAKVDESQIFALYSDMGKVDLINADAERGNSWSTERNMGSSKLSTKFERSPRNPFARGDANMDDNSDRMESVRGEGSIIKISRQMNNIDDEDTKRKRKFDCLSFDQDDANVEVRSRFFATNIEKVQQQSPVSPSQTLKDDLKATAVNELHRASSLPLRLQEIAEDLTIVNAEEDETGKDATHATKSNILRQQSSVIASNSTDRQPTSAISRISTAVKYPNQRLPRLGLSRPKVTDKLKSKAVTDRNQLSLSAFGFQKRPALT